MLQQRKPKFKVGDNVKMLIENLQGETTGKVSEVNRIYKEVYPGTNEIDPDGLTISENTIKTISVPYKFDGDVLEIQSSSGKTRKHIFAGYNVVVISEKMNTMINENYVQLNT